MMFQAVFIITLRPDRFAGAIILNKLVQYLELHPYIIHFFMRKLLHEKYNPINNYPPHNFLLLIDYPTKKSGKIGINSHPRPILERLKP